MSTNRLYYQVKPYLPWRLRMILRRMVALRQRKACQDVWPIKDSAGRPPAGWPGWPDGKKFAFVLTHDVEGPAGLAKCRQLMQIEKELGLRSCFNFIPEGDYAVSRELRTELVQNGFEVGVHDLRHDGRLYQSRPAFIENAKWINHYLKEWGATGFRSGFMLRNLDWLHELDIRYDTSTFDTDPFEPQPEGADTIFPFWVQCSDSEKGYVELPYTLPQDFTQFIVLKEQGPDLWKRKLAWIIDKGGMALMDVHPDYINFTGQDLKDSEFPAVWYRDFLQHVKLNHADECWFALPGEVADWYREVSSTTRKQQATAQIPALPRIHSVAALANQGPFSGKHAAVVLYSYYESDARPRREAESLARAGMQVDVISLRERASQALREKINGVNVFRVPLKRRRLGKLTYALQYSLFLFASFFLLSFWRLKRRFDLVHVHNMPDVLVFSAMIPRFFGAKVILDLHDPMPELFSSIYNLPAEHRVTRLLKRLEKLSIWFAHLVLTPNQAFKEIFVSRGCPEAKIQLLINVPDEEIFNLGKSDSVPETPSNERPFVIIYHGLLVERHGLHLAVQAIAKLRTRIPRIQFHVYGEPTSYMQKILRLTRELGLENIVQYHGFKPLDSMARIISTIDVGLIPNRLNLFTDINLPTRIFEYLAMNKPVIVPSTKGIRDYFNQTEILFFEPENVDDMVAKIEWVYAHPAGAKEFVEQGRKVYEKYRWQLEEQRFLGLLGGLLESKAGQRCLHPGRQPRKICMVVHSNYDTDNRVMRYAETLASAGTNGSATAVAPPALATSEPDQAAERFNQDLFETTGRQDAGAGKPSRLQGRHVAVLLFSHYPSDPRPKRAAEALAQEGAEVDFLCLRGDSTEPKRESVNGLNIFRVPLKRSRGGKSDYFLQYGAFICVAFFFLASRSMRRRYDLVHVHNMPDVLVFGALIPKLLGAKVILDLHDPMPELMLTIFKLPPESFSVRMLKMLEKWSTGFANVVLTVNLASKRIYASRSCVPEKIQVVMNSPNEEVFRFQPPSPSASKANSSGNFTIMYHGSLLARNGFDLAVQALETVRKSIPGANLLVCGERTPFFESVIASARERGLQSAVNYLGKKKLEEIVETMNFCDLGIIPNHRNIFTEMNTPTRIFEYLSRGKPVIAPRARGIQDYFGEQDLIYFELGDAGDLARKIEYACFHPAEVRATVERGQKVYLAHRWSQESLGFVDTVADLLGQR